MMKRLLFVMMVAMAMVVGASALPSIPNDYNSVTSLTYNITAPVGAQTNYQIKFILSNASGISGYYAPDNVIFTNGTTRPDWNDINATDGSNTPLPFWIENNTQTAKNATAWVRVPTIAIGNTSTAKWYYGNASQIESAMNGLNTFPYFSDWGTKTALNTSQETRVLTGGSESFSGSMMFVTGASTEQVSSLTAFGSNYSYRGYGNASAESATYIQGFCSASAAGCDGAILSLAGNTQKWSGKGALAARSQSIATTTMNLYELSRYDYSTNFSYNDVVQVTNSGVGSTAYNWTMYVDGGIKTGQRWSFVRKRVYPEPITSLYSTSGIAPAPTASFTCTPTSTTLGTPITCTDASTNAPTNWTYCWGDGNVTDGTQNPSYTYPFTGTFSINQTVNNSAGASWYNRSNYITITNVTSFTQQDIYLTGQYTITFNVKSSTTNLPIANVTVVDSVSGQSYPSTNGTAFLTLPAGLYYINFIADGYQSKQVTYVVDQDEVHEVKMVPASTVPTSTSTWYSPHQVRFAVVDSMGAKVVGSSINATVIASTFPQDGTTDWLTAMYGIAPEVANDMLNGTLIMHGTTQSDGATVFTMHSSIGYSLAVTNPSNGVVQTVNVTPIDTIYTIHLLGTAANNTYMDMGYNTSLYVTEPDVHNVTMNLAYQDMSARTTLLEFFVLARINNTVINYQSTTSIGSNIILMNYTVPNIKPDRYSWYYNAVRIT